MAMEINVIIDGDFEECSEVGWLQGVAERILIAQGVTSSVELGRLLPIRKGYES